MPLAHKVRAMLAGLAKFGEPSLLAGAPCGHTSIERNVVLHPGIGDTADDNHIVRVIVATVALAPSSVDALLGVPAGTTLVHNPRVGQALIHPSEGNFRLDRLLEDNGIVRRFIAVPA